MKIAIKQSPREPWGRLSIEDTRNASRILSGDAFKVWVDLSLNQDGYTYQWNLCSDIVQELTDNGYMAITGKDSFVFNAGGNTEAIKVPPAWIKITELYGTGDVNDYQYVTNRLASLTLADRANEILEYWIRSYSNLKKSGHVSVKNVLRYDFAIMLAWWIKENFRFRIGDVIYAGPKGSQLRFHSDIAKNEIQRSIMEHGSNTFTIHKKNISYWNDRVRKGLIEFRPESIGDILQKRKHRQ